MGGSEKKIEFLVYNLRLPITVRLIPNTEYKLYLELTIAEELYPNLYILVLVTPPVVSMTAAAQFAFLPVLPP